MSFAVLGDLNWLAVMVLTVVYFALGGLWFSPLMFANAWTRAIGWNMEEGQRPGAAFYIGPVITSFLGVLALAMLTVATDSDTFAEGLVLGLVTAIGIVAAQIFLIGYFEPTKPQPMVWVAITGGYHVTAFLIAAVVLAIWR